MRDLTVGHQMPRPLRLKLSQAGLVTRTANTFPTRIVLTAHGLRKGGSIRFAGSLRDRTAHHFPLLRLDGRRCSRADAGDLHDDLFVFGTVEVHRPSRVLHVTSRF